MSCRIQKAAKTALPLALAMGILTATQCSAYLKAFNAFPAESDLLSVPGGAVEAKKGDEKAPRYRRLHWNAVTSPRTPKTVQ